MSDTRDTNRDGHVSLMEKVKDKLHLGHKDKDAEYTATHHTTSTAHHATPVINASSKHTTPIVGTVPLGTSAVPLAGAMPTEDFNRDGHISTSERLASSALPSSSISSFSDSRDLNRDGHVSTAEKLATAGRTSGFTDSRDLNRDGHISASERLAAGSHSSGFNDSRDLNRDGHISASERLAGGFQDDQARLRLHEEQLAIAKREVGAGEVDIHKRVQQEHVQQTIPVRREEVIVERHALHGAAEPGAQIAAHDEVIRVPLYREEILTEKRLVPTEEVIVRKKEVVDQQTVGATLRSEFVETTQPGMTTHAAGFDARDTNRDGHVSMGEKFGAGTASSTYGAFDPRDTNRDGHVSMGEKLKGGNATGFGDSRDLNRDGHVSMGEKLKGNATGFGDNRDLNRDLNRDGHVSMGEKLKTAPDMNGDGRVSMGEKIKAARG